MSRLAEKRDELWMWQRIVVVESCWEWVGTIHNTGYGCMSDETGRQVRPHRFMWELMRGPIPPGLTIDHLCRNKRCVNPDHMEVVTFGENTLRGNAWSGVNKRKTHCNHGHPFSGENLAITPQGYRSCRACSRANTAASRQRKLAASGPRVRKIPVPKPMCKRGHPLSGDNVYVWAGNPNARYCRACRRELYLRRAAQH